jgi:hypothetical protein
LGCDSSSSQPFVFLETDTLDFMIRKQFQVSGVTFAGSKPGIGEIRSGSFIAMNVPISRAAQVAEEERQA